MTKIEIGNLNILDVSNNFYAVPDYQREGSGLVSWHYQSRTLAKRLRQR